MAEEGAGAETPVEEEEEADDEEEKKNAAEGGFATLDELIMEAHAGEEAEAATRARRAASDEGVVPDMFRGWREGERREKKGKGGKESTCSSSSSSFFLLLLLSPLFLSSSLSPSIPSDLFLWLSRLLLHWPYRA